MNPETNKTPRKSTLTEKAHAFNRRKFNKFIPSYKGGLYKIAMLSESGELMRVYISGYAAARDNWIQYNQVRRCYSGTNKIKKTRLCFSKKMGVWVTFIKCCKVVKKTV